MKLARGRLVLVFVILRMLVIGSPAAAASPPEFYLQWGTPGATPGQFNHLRALAIDVAGNIYVADRFNDRVQKFNSMGVFVTSWGSSGSGNGQFLDPVGIAVDASGNVYVTDWQLHRVQKFNGATGAYITRWGTSGSANGQFNLPAGIATDSAGNVYVCDSGNFRIQEFDGSGTFLRTWGQNGSGPGQFNRPYGVTVDAAGFVYVADRFNTRVQKFTSTGAFQLQWGSPGVFSFPDGMAVGPDGDIYVGDWDLNTIQRFHPDGTFVEQWGSAGSGPGQFSNLAGLAVDAMGCVYAGDYGNARVEKFCNCDDPVSVPAGFHARVLATIPLPAVARGFSGIALPPPGSAFPAGVYAAFSTFQTNGAGNPPDDFLYRVGFDGAVTQLLAFPRDETNPIDIEFGPEGAFGGDLYIAANDFDNYQAGDFGGAILKLDTASTLTTFFPNNNSLISEPVSLAFAPASAAGFPPGLYVANPNPPSPLFSLTSSATPGTFTLTGTNVGGLAFGPGGAFGTDVYVGTEDGHVDVASSAGSRVHFASGLGGWALRLKFAPTGGFGPYLYALLNTGTMVRIDAAGNTTPFLTGLCGPTDVWNDFAFTADGQAMYLTDAGGRRILAIDAISPTLSTVTPWDAYGHALVIPGTTSTADVVTITLRDASGSPVSGIPVAIDLAACSGLCIDQPSGLTATTDASGVARLNPRVGGCADCPVTITANGVPIRGYSRVVSPDWDGTRSDGQVDCVDSTYFATHYAVYESCLDYNGNGTVNLSEFAIFGDALGHQSANSALCGSPAQVTGTVMPWDDYHQAFVSPGAGSDEVTLSLRDSCGRPLRNTPVQIDLAGCQDLCVDSPDDGLTGVTDASGVVVLDPRVGGCEDCPVVVKVNGSPFRTFTRVTSPDWDGVRADGLVDCRDLAYLQRHLLGSEHCADYDGNGSSTALDMAKMAACLGKSNTTTCGAPCVSICAQPAGRQVTAGQPATFTISAVGQGPLAFQWRKDGVAIPGATGASLTIDPAQCCDAGLYDVVITAPCGSITSAAATLGVAPPDWPGTQYFRRSATCAISGSFSLWAGVTSAEAVALGYAAGQGYGNNWDYSLRKRFYYPGSGTVTVSFRYAVDAEAGFDFTEVLVDTTGGGCGAGEILLLSHDGNASGTDVITLTPGMTLPRTAGPIALSFRVQSDAAGSDQDGDYQTSCGHSAFDDIQLTGAIQDLSDFETGGDGWVSSLCVVTPPDSCDAADRWLPVAGPDVPGSPLGPSQRMGHAMAADTSGYVVLFGGEGTSSRLGDTWRWNGSFWQPLQTTPAPPARSGHAMAFDARRNRVVLFGGTNGTTNLGDTWEWDGTQWALASTTGPSPRQGHVMVYDAFRQRVVLFGGNDGALKGDTWVWNGSAWRALSAPGPTARQFAAATYDPGLGMIVLFGGESADPSPVKFSDTWELNDSTWAEQDTLHVSPGARSRHAMAYANDCSLPTLFGGSGTGDGALWRWSGADWRLDPASGPAPRHDFAMAYDRVGQKIIIFGGQTESNQPSLLGDTWELCSPCDMEEAPLDSLGRVILPANIDRSEPVVDEAVYGPPRNVTDAYPGYATSTDLWYRDLPCPAAVGGSLPSQASGQAVRDYLSERYPGLTPEDMADSLLSWEDQILRLDQQEPADPDSLGTHPAADSLWTDPANPYVPDADGCYVFGGRDIIFVHGFQRDPIVDKITDPTGPASVTWQFGNTFPADLRNPSFYDSTLYWKGRANDYWRLHIQRFLESRHIMNRYLVVAWPSTQRLPFAALAVLTQISDAMKYETGVVDPSGRNNHANFGTPSFVVVSHSTGGLVADVALAAAHSIPPLHARFISDHCKAHVALHDAFSGSALATVAVAVSKALVPEELTWACDIVNSGLFGNGLPVCNRLTAIDSSILRDLVPAVTQQRWGLLESLTPVRTLTISGGQPATLFSSDFQENAEYLLHILHPGFDDGTLALNSQSGNPNLSILPVAPPLRLWPSGFITFPLKGHLLNYDMGIDWQRAVPLFLDQAVDPEIVRHPLQQL